MAAFNIIFDRNATNIQNRLISGVSYKLTLDSKPDPQTWAQMKMTEKFDMFQNHTSGAYFFAVGPVEYEQLHEDEKPFWVTPASLDHPASQEGAWEESKWLERESLQKLVDTIHESGILKKSALEQTLSMALSLAQAYTTKCYRLIAILAGTAGHVLFNSDKPYSKLLARVTSIMHKDPEAGDKTFCGIKFKTTPLDGDFPDWFPIGQKTVDGGALPNFEPEQGLNFLMAMQLAHGTHTSIAEDKKVPKALRYGLKRMKEIVQGNYNQFENYTSYSDEFKQQEDVKSEMIKYLAIFFGVIEGSSPKRGLLALSADDRNNNTACNVLRVYSNSGSYSSSNCLMAAGLIATTKSTKAMTESVSRLSHLFTEEALENQATVLKLFKLYTNPVTFMAASFAFGDGLSDFKNMTSMFHVNAADMHNQNMRIHASLAMGSGGFESTPTLESFSSFFMNDKLESVGQSHVQGESVDLNEFTRKLPVRYVSFEVKPILGKGAGAKKTVKLSITVKTRKEFEDGTFREIDVTFSKTLGTVIPENLRTEGFEFSEFNTTDVNKDAMNSYLSRSISAFTKASEAAKDDAKAQEDIVRYFKRFITGMNEVSLCLVAPLVYYYSKALKIGNGETAFQSTRKEIGKIDQRRRAVGPQQLEIQNGAGQGNQGQVNAVELGADVGM